MKIILLAILALYVSAMFVAYCVATKRSVRDGKIGIIKAVIIFPFAFTLFLVIFPIGAIGGILRIRKTHV